MRSAPRVGVHERDLREALQRRGDVCAAAGREEDALPVRGVTADADVAHDREVGDGLLHCSDGAKEDVVALGGEDRVLVLPVGHAEDEETADPGLGGRSRLTHELREREALETRSGRCALDRLAVLDRRRYHDR